MGFVELHIMKTFSAKPAEVKRDWYVIDATDKVLGRLSSEIARRLRGKHKPEYTPHVDTGDYIIVVNAEKVRTTGRKTSDKMYYRDHRLYWQPEVDFAGKMLQQTPERVIQIAVKGMLPKNPLGRAMFRKLKVYVGAEHQHAAQQPQPLEL
jgi:large subunit ribosomal protein L13